MQVRACAHRRKNSTNVIAKSNNLAERFLVAPWSYVERFSSASSISLWRASGLKTLQQTNQNAYVQIVFVCYISHREGLLEAI